MVFGVAVLAGECSAERDCTGSVDSRSDAFSLSPLVILPQWSTTLVLK